MLSEFECVDREGDFDSSTFYNHLNDSDTKINHNKGTVFTFCLVNVAQSKNDIIGYYTFVLKRCKTTTSMPSKFTKLPENSIRAFVKYIAVSEKYRGMGFLKAILASVKIHAKELSPNVKMIQLQAIPSALPKYVHYGFVPYIEEDLDDPDKEDGLQMCAIII
jgi:GNAT superfamily N-acetyltransferase